MAWEIYGEALPSISKASDVIKLQRDLARKHRNAGPRVIEMWRGFTRKQRERAMRESTGDGMVLKHSRDPGLDHLYHLIAEYNLRDITSEPDHFLDLFQFRATTDLSNQVRLSDGPHILDMMTNHGLRHQPLAAELQHDTMLFLEGKDYGRCWKPTDPTASFATLAPQITAAGLAYPAATGQLIIVRQVYLLQFLNHLVEEILELGSQI